MVFILFFQNFQLKMLLHYSSQIMKDFESFTNFPDSLLCLAVYYECGIGAFFVLLKGLATE